MGKQNLLHLYHQFSLILLLLNPHTLLHLLQPLPHSRHCTFHSAGVNNMSVRIEQNHINIRHCFKKLDSEDDDEDD